MAYETRSKIKTTSFTEKEFKLIEQVIEKDGHKSYSNYAHDIVMKQFRKDAKKLNISEE